MIRLFPLPRPPFPRQTTVYYDVVLGAHFVISFNVFACVFVLCCVDFDANSPTHIVLYVI